LLLDFSAWQPVLLGLVFAGLALMGAGFLWRDRRAHLLRAAGWTLFAVYWPFQAPEFFWPTHTTEPDPINGWFTLVGPLFLLYIAWHEWRSYQWDEDPAALRWFTGASFVAAITYFVIAASPAVQRLLIDETARQSAWMYNLVLQRGHGAAFTVPDPVMMETHLCIPDPNAIPSPFCPGGADYAVSVILACTAIQSIMIFVGAIACVAAAPGRKWLAYLYTAPVIYALNLFRNAGIVFGSRDLKWGMFGMSPFEWMHSYVGKIGSLLAMVFIALAVFATLPELHGNILDLFDLWKRKKAGFFDRPPPPPKGAPEPSIVDA
jgi:archaeosortase A (PGF-CTERM-specific)